LDVPTAAQDEGDALNSVLLFAIGAAMVGVGWMLTLRLTPEPARPQRVRGLLYWALKGLLVPLVLWAAMNVGLSWYFQPFMPQIQAAQSSGKGWAATYFGVIFAGWFIISSCWAAATLGWGLTQATATTEGEVRARLKALCWTCVIGLGLPALALLWFGGWPTLGLAATTILAPIAAYAPPILHTEKRPPLYTRAIAKLKFGKYSEAEWEIIRELEKCEDDFEGWMMLAELYATHFQNLAEAERTVLEACSQPGINPSQLSAALHRLADWHLKIGSDPETARWALQIICDRLKGTHLAHMAQLRIKQLPLTAQELREQQVAKPIPLPALGDTLDEGPPAAVSKLERHKAARLANECVAKLKHDPDNVPAREKLARLFAEQLERADLGIEQVNLLLEMPDQPEGRKAEWWGLIAAWHLRYRHDPDAAREVLERVVHEFPRTPQALAATRRLGLIEAERRRRTSSSRTSA
jgi:hypothetical protein